MKKKLVYFLIACCCAVQLNAQSEMKNADSLFFAQDWKAAKNLYEKLLNDTSTNAIAWNRLGFCYYNLSMNDKAMPCYEKALKLNGSAGLKASVYSRMARIFAQKNDAAKTVAAIDSAISNGYFNLKELDTLSEFNSVRKDENFVVARNKLFNSLYPCYTDMHAREFDFWIGEWDVYVTGTKQLAGHSLIQMISGGCAILENWDSPASTGKSINFIEPVTNKWKQSWSGSYPNGNQEFVNGEYKDSAMRFTFETTDGQGNKIIGRFIFYNQGPNQVRQFNETSSDNGKTWTTSYDFTYVRKK